MSLLDKIGRRRRGGMWDDSWDVDEPPTLYLEPTDEDSDDGYIRPSAEERESGEGLFISWGMLAGVIIALLVVITFVWGLFFTHYAQDGKAILETPSYRAKVSYARDVEATWSEAQAIDQKAYSETTSYMTDKSNPFVLSQDMTKDASGITQLKAHLEKMKVPPEYQTFQDMVDTTMTLQIKDLTAESQTVIASTSPNMKTVLSSYQSVQAEEKLVDKEVSDMLTLYNIK